jgi:hypothetical protein
VTSLQYKIYDVPATDIWTYESFIYSQDKPEALYTAINTLTANGTQPAGLLNFSLYMRVTAIDPVNVCLAPPLLSPLKSKNIHANSTNIPSPTAAGDCLPHYLPGHG